MANGVALMCKKGKLKLIYYSRFFIRFWKNKSEFHFFAQQFVFFGNFLIPPSSRVTICFLKSLFLSSTWWTRFIQDWPKGDWKRVRWYMGVLTNLLTPCPFWHDVIYEWPRNNKKLWKIWVHKNIMKFKIKMNAGS